MTYSFTGSETVKKTCHLCKTSDEHKPKLFARLPQKTNLGHCIAACVEGHGAAVLPSRADLQPAWWLLEWSSPSSDCLVWLNLTLCPFWGFSRETNLFFSHLAFPCTSFPLTLTPAVMVINTSQLPSSPELLSLAWETLKFTSLS